MKPKTLIIIIAVVLFLLTAAILLIKYFTRKDVILDGPGMVGEDTFDFSQTYLSRVYYWRGAGELGDSYSVELTMEPGEQGQPVVIVSYHNQPAHDAKAVDKTVRVSSNVIVGVQEIIDRYGMTEWTDLPPAEVFALDAPSTSLTYEYSDGTSYTIGSDDELPEGGYQAMHEIRQYIVTCAGIEE